MNLLNIYKDDLEPPRKNYFRYIITLLKWCGVGLEDIENRGEALFFKIYTFIITVPSMYYYIVAESIDFALHLDDLEYASFSLCYLVTQIFGVLKGIILFINRKSICEYLKNLESGFFLPNLERGGTNENKFINRAVKYSNLVAIVIIFLTITIVSTRGISSFSEVDFEESFDYGMNQTICKALKVLPYNIYLPFDTQKHYYWAFYYQLTSCTLMGLYIGGCDALMTGIIMHVKAQILILKNSVLCIKDRAYDMYEKSNNNNILNRNDNPLEKVPQEIQVYVTRIIRDVIKHHQEIIKLVDETEDKFNMVLLLQFLVSLIVMCQILFQLSINNVNSPNFFSMASYLAFMLFQLLIYCWNGNELSLESMDVARAAFDCDWIQFDNDSQKSLMLIMLRSQRAFRLSAGKFAYLSLETYTTIVRGSASYYLALRNMNEE